MTAKQKLAANNPDIKKRLDLLNYRCIEELYDLEKDPDEMNNVFGQKEYAEIKKMLELRLAELQLEYDDKSMEYVTK